MKAQISRFNETGIESFRNILNDIRRGEFDEDNISELLTDPYSCDNISTEVKIEQKNFETKQEIVEYLSDSVSKLPNYRNLLNDAGLWTWLSAFYFDTVCPQRQDGTRKPGDDARHILNAETWNRYYRHLLASPVRLYQQLGSLSKIYLTGTPDKHGDLMEQLASRQEIAACRSVIEAATILYWDESRNKIKKRAKNKDGAGVLRRFRYATLPQFQMTYDLNSMKGDDLLSLLPTEYDEWKITQ